MPDLRSRIEEVLERLNYEPVRSDQNDISYPPNEHTHVSCIKSVSECDMLVLLVGDSFGGKAITEAINLVKSGIYNGRMGESRVSDFIDNFNKGVVSITQLETLQAFNLGLPVFAFVDSTLATQYEKYLKASRTLDEVDLKENSDLKYVFPFLDYISNRKYNNGLFRFSSSEELERVLKDQISHFFQRLLELQRARLRNGTTEIGAQIVNHTSSERRKAFNDLFSEVGKIANIKILGTGVTSFLNNEEQVEGFLRDGTDIQILLVNDQIVKKDWSCSSAEFVERLNTKLASSKLRFVLDEITAKTSCPLASLNFLIDKSHFNKYYQREEYSKKIGKSYKKIVRYREDIEKKKWEGNLEARHFQSFVPMSITAIEPLRSKMPKLLVEFIVPFSEERIILRSTFTENRTVSRLFLDFFNDTWDKGFPV